MNAKRMLLGVLVLAAAGFLTGCNGEAATAEATDIPIVADASSGTVVAEAVIEPARTEELGFEMGGKVIEVLVVKGDAIRAGDVIALTTQQQRTRGWRSPPRLPRPETASA